MTSLDGYCTKCEQSLPESAFSPAAFKRSRRNWCKPCRATYLRKRRKERGLFATKLHNVCQRDGCGTDISHKRADAKWCSTACSSAAWHDAYPGGRRAWRIKYAYGLSLEQFNALLAAQGGLCAICRTGESTNDGRWAVWNVDHCHKTGAVRGVLCSSCNVAIGQLKDDPELVRSALKYLERHELGREEFPLP